MHHAAHAQLTIFREKMCHPNSARQPVKSAARVRSQVLDRESRREGGGGSVAKESGRGEKKERRKAREALLSVVVLYHFSKSFYLVLFPPPSLLFLLFVTSSFPPYHHLSLPLPFCLLRHEEHRICRGRGIRFHVYTQDGSDWPGLKPSQITP